MSHVIVGVICAVVFFVFGNFIGIRYLSDWVDWCVRKYNEKDGQLDSFVERIAAWVKGA
jgi:hypothetical protein